jgi:membrane-bound lytic murein transglycosylase B
MQLTVICAVLALVLAGCGGHDGGRKATGAAADGPPPADAPIPHDAAALARRLTDTQRSLGRAVNAWKRDGDPARGAPPEEVTLYALDQQRVHMLLSARPRLAHAVLARLPGRIAAHARATLRARRELAPLATPQPTRAWTTGPARPAGELLRDYREAQGRFGVGWPVLASVNLIESAFGRMRNTSTAGAQGPMQFIPATWAAYGMGGNIRDPHDAILGAANYLHANGAPRDYRAALYHYNPSSHYVDAVLAYANRIRRDPRNFFSYYAWQVFVRTPDGTRRITGPGL